MRLGGNLLANPINTALATPPIAQLVGSSVSLIEAAVHVVNANTVAVPPEKTTTTTKVTGFEQTVDTNMSLHTGLRKFVQNITFHEYLWLGTTHIPKTWRIVFLYWATIKML